MAEFNVLKNDREQLIKGEYFIKGRWIRGARDIITITPEAMDREIIPDNYPFDKNGDPVYSYTTHHAFEELSEDDLEFLIDQLKYQMYLKWEKAHEKFEIETKICPKCGGNHIGFTHDMADQVCYLCDDCGFTWKIEMGQSRDVREEVK